MLKGILAAALVATAATASYLSTSSTELCHFLPDNDLYIGVDQVSATGGGLTEAQFNSVLDRIQAQYKDELAALGANLTISRQWDNGTVNASAEESGKNWVINMYGGLARHETITEDGFALVACHEMGHHLGGAPKMGSWYGGWATNEGGADYYATLKCLRRFFAQDDNMTVLSNMELNKTVVKNCQASFSDKTEQMLCVRGTMAGYSVSNLFQVLTGSATASTVETPDPSKVSKTDNAHPDTQCRLDTYFAGALCPIPVANKISNTDYHDGFCADASKYPALSLRPRCWFKPSESDNAAPSSVKVLAARR